MPTQFAIMNNLIDEAADFRRTGSAALDLCYVASGRVDGYFEMGLKPWDCAAGDLIVREAGGLVWISMRVTAIYAQVTSWLHQRVF